MEERIEKLSLDAARWWNRHLGAKSEGFVDVLYLLIKEELEANRLITIKCSPDEVDNIIIKAVNATKVDINPKKNMLMIISTLMGIMVLTKKGFIQISI